MSDNDLKQRLHKAMRKRNAGSRHAGHGAPFSEAASSAAHTEGYEDVRGAEPGIPDLTGPGPERAEVRKKAEKLLKRFGWLGIGAFAVAIWFSPSSPTYLTGDEAKQVLADGMSGSVTAGTVLLAADENMAPQDYTITHQSQQESTAIWVWDYAAEDGDYVQILYNGAPMTDAFMIKHKPKRFDVPAVGLVQIRGVRDGGGGITYAVRYELSGTTYFNSAPEGEHNTYTLIRE